MNERGRLMNVLAACGVPYALGLPPTVALQPACRISRRYVRRGIRQLELLLAAVTS